MKPFLTVLELRRKKRSREPDAAGVKYNTDKSYALSNTYYSDGENEYIDGKAIELYMDTNGGYFFAERHEDGSAKIIPVDASIAAPFIEKYGTDIEKKPKE